jgi:formylglycine-generating enzyme
MKSGVVAGVFVLFAVMSCGHEGRDFGTGSAGSIAQGGDDSAGSGSEGGTTGEPLETVGGGGGAGAAEPLETVGGGGGQSPLEPTTEGSGLGTLGEPCSEAGARACEGHAQGEQLLCEAGVWTSNGSCPAGQHCDTREGASQGLCQAVVPACEGQAAGTPVCRDNNVELCDADQLSTTLQTACTSCDSGSCSCPAGTHGVDGGFTECRGCESGSFAAEPNLQQCAPWSNCEAGKRVTNTPSASQDRACAACPAGKFTSGPNQSECLDANACPAGTIQTAPGTASIPPTCSACGAGTYCAGGTAAAVPCAAGDWDHDASAATACVAKTTCNTGQYISSAGSATTNRTCSSCAAGSYSTGTNAASCTTCTTCNAGTYASTACSATTNRACTACGADSYSTGTNAASCTTCATCNAGTYASTACSATTNRACTACAAGRYSTGTNAASCPTCTAACSAAAGTFESTACSVTTNRVCTAFPSCQGLAASCGASANDGCCKSPTVAGTAPGAPFYRGTDTSYPATISTFALDKYEVTVGRFRKFVAAYAGPPAAGAGAHPLISNSGWQTAWNSSIAADSVALTTAVQCNASTQTWFADGSTDRLPMNCVSWFEAFAFCAWDGGRLPTETEWEYAAAGGSTNDWTYPWGSMPPVWDQPSTQANFECWGGGDQQACTFSDILPVGSKPAGAGIYGQLDLAGSMWEWSLDWWNVFTVSCANCANLTPALPAPDSERMKRGGAWNYDSSYLTATYRNYAGTPAYHNSETGFRCARTP